MKTMMKNNKLISLVIIVFISLCLGGVAYSAIKYTADINNTCTTKNNNTRDYTYEQYCDSIYATNPDYYYDVLVETDKFQSYLNEHGKWWDN